MFIVKAAQIKNLSLNHEQRIIREIFAIKRSMYSKSEFSDEVLMEKVKVSFYTARHYNFTEKGDIVRFVELSFESELLSGKPPLNERIHQILVFPDRSAKMKFDIIGTVLSKEL